MQTPDIYGLSGLMFGSTPLAVSELFSLPFQCAPESTGSRAALMATSQGTLVPLWFLSQLPRSVPSTTLFSAQAGDRETGWASRARLTASRGWFLMEVLGPGSVSSSFPAPQGTHSRSLHHLGLQRPVKVSPHPSDSGPRPLPTAGAPHQPSSL